MIFVFEAVRSIKWRIRGQLANIGIFQLTCWEIRGFSFELAQKTCRVLMKPYICVAD